MTEPTARRVKLREQLLPLARTRIADRGLTGFRARDLAADAGCALGTIYNAFDDLDELVLYVNSGTLADLDQKLRDAVAAAQQPPVEQLVALAHAYLDFAIEHPHLWMSLFEHRMPPGREVPAWHLQEHDVLFRHIARLLEELMGAPSPELVRLKARTLFSAVHGVVSLGLERRFIAVPADLLRTELADLVRACASSIGAPDRGFS